VNTRDDANRWLPRAQLNLLGLVLWQGGLIFILGGRDASACLVVAKHKSRHYPDFCKKELV
jgi:hypothetical protein